MNKQELYNIIDNVDGCFYGVAAITDVTRLFQAAFIHLDNNDGDSSAKFLIHHLEDIESQLDKLHTRIDKYILDNIE